MTAESAPLLVEDINDALDVVLLPWSFAVAVLR